MSTSQNGTSPDGRYVDRVEETISGPSCRHFTKSELKVARSEVTTQSVLAVESSFRETAYLNNLGRHTNGGTNGVGVTMVTADSEDGQGAGTRVESNSKLVSGNADFDLLEQSIDRIETMLCEKEHLEGERATVSSTARTQTDTKSGFQQVTGSSSQSSESTGTGASSSEETELYVTEADRQPFMTVDPNDILNRDQSKDSSSFTQFLTIKQKRESFGNEVETAEFERLLEEQLQVQKEREQREQRLMEKMCGTIPAYRSDWMRKNSPQEVTATMSTSYGSESAADQLGTQAAVSSSSEQVSQDPSADWAARDREVRTAVSEVGTSYHVDTSNLSSSPVSVKELEAAVLTQGSVTEPGSLIEIERKFVLTENSEKRLLELGATLLSEKSFHDIYYDTPKYKLTLGDLWLRQRDNKWELKTPVTGASRGTSCSQYNEFTSEKAIVAELSSSLCLDTGMSSVSLKELVQIGLLNEFCSFTTTRKSYGLKNCSIDLDVTSFGVKIGEIEMVVVDANRIPEALEAVDEIAKQLELQPYPEANLQLTI